MERSLRPAISCSGRNYKSRKIIRKLLKNDHPVLYPTIYFQWNKDQRPFEGSPASLKAFAYPSGGGYPRVDRSFLFPVLCVLRQGSTLPSIFAMVGSTCMLARGA